MKSDTIKSTIPCFLCGEKTEIRTSKKDKPYMVCEKCGLQIFIRKEKAEELLKTLEKGSKKLGSAPIPGSSTLYSTIIHLETLIEKQEELREKIGIFNFSGRQEGHKLALKALEKEIDALERKLKTNLD